jgi:hypothetical protein
MKVTAFTCLAYLKKKGKKRAIESADTLSSKVIKKKKKNLRLLAEDLLSVVKRVMAVPLAPARPVLPMR